MKSRQPPGAPLRRLSGLRAIPLFENLVRRGPFNPFLQQKTHGRQIGNGLGNRILRSLVKTRATDFFHDLMYVMAIDRIDFSHQFSLSSHQLSLERNPKRAAVGAMPLQYSKL